MIALRKLTFIPQRRSAHLVGGKLLRIENAWKGKRMTKTKYILLSIVAIVCVTFAAISAFNGLGASKPYYTLTASERSPEELKAACTEHIEKADRKAAAAIAKRSKEFASFIESKKFGAKPFSRDIASFYGKWRAVKPYLPFTKENGHKKFVERKFAEHIFSESDFAEAMRLAIEGSIKDIEAIENELAVTLRAEILGNSLSSNEIPIAAEQFSQAIEQLVTAAQRDAAKTAGSLVASEVTAQVATQVLIRLGVSAGILTAGAANSWWSVGASLVIGLIVDLAWQWIDDPKGDIQREMANALDKLSKDASTTMENEMNRVLSERSGLWFQAAAEMMP